MEILVGCCGWGYFRPKDFFGTEWKNKFKSVLQAYASKFNLCEVNSTFYRIPRLSTVEKWRKQVDEINPNFEFTVKANRQITHQIMFTRKASQIFLTMVNVCKVLRAKVLLLQSPAKFKPKSENIARMDDFFQSIERKGIIIAWESRGEWRNRRQLVEDVCKRHELVDCVDPLRDEPLYLGRKRVAYFRLHGFGRPMYNYRFSKKELLQVREKVMSINAKRVYLLFNNFFMYEQAMMFRKMIKGD